MGVKDDAGKPDDAAQARTVLERNIYIIMALDYIFKMNNDIFTLSFHFLLIKAFQVEDLRSSTTSRRMWNYSEIIKLYTQNQTGRYVVWFC